MKGALAAVTILALAVMTGQDPRDVKGWHGSEWGMNTEQLKAAVGMTLEPTNEGSFSECKTGTPGSKLFRATTSIDVGSLSGSPRFCVTDREGLVAINIEFGAHALDYVRIREELTGTHGRPTFEELGSPRGVIVMKSAHWVLPKTQISVSSFQSPSLNSLSVSYVRRKPESFLHGGSARH